MNQCAGDGDALPHASGKCANGRTAALEQADFAKKFFCTRVGLLYVLQPGEENQILFGGQFIVNHGGVRDVAWTAMRCVGVFRTGKREFARGGTNDLRGYAKEGGFSGAVAPGQDNAFAGINLERNAAESV